MLRFYVIIVIFLLGCFPGGIVAQISLECDKFVMDAGTDVIMKDDTSVISARSWYSAFPDDAHIVFCPAGIERSSPNDVKKKFPFEWKVKYDNIYVEVFQGLAVEGMNEHGLSVSLMLLDKTLLPKKDKTLIPIAVSLWTSFFLDHFKCIDTAMLAVWDIRLFNDLDSDCDWPFRLIMHDSSGATAYIEYVNGDLRVYTPDDPAVITDGQEYAQLLINNYIPENISKGSPESRFNQVSDMLTHYNQPISYSAAYGILEQFPQDGINGWFIARDHKTASLQFLSYDGKKADFKINKLNFTPGQETKQKLFE